MTPITDDHLTMRQIEARRKALRTRFDLETRKPIGTWDVCAIVAELEELANLEAMGDEVALLVGKETP